MISKNLKVAFTALWAVGALVVSASASVVPGSGPKAWPANPARHELSIERIAETKSEARMIAIAESTYPTAQAMKREIPELADQNIQKKQWWYIDQATGIRLPYALTKGTVEYYSTMIKENKDKTWNTYIEPSSKFSYKATAAFKPIFEQGDKKFTNVFLVNMSAVFDASFTINGTEILHFQKNRTVVLDKKAKVLAIYGDGKTDMPIAAI